MPVLFKGQAFSFIEGRYVTTRHRRVKHKPSAQQPHNQKGTFTTSHKKISQGITLRDSCRGDRIRTCDPLVPNQMRYQLRYTPNDGFNFSGFHPDFKHEHR